MDERTLLSEHDAREAAEAAGISPALAGPHLFRFALKNPRLARVYADIVDVAVLNGRLDARLREIAILRVGWRIGSVYEWSNHVPLARRAGVTDEELLAVRTADGSVLGPGELAVIALVDEVLDQVEVSAATLEQARAVVGEADALLELVAIPGFYRAIGSMLLTFEVPLEPHIDRWPPDGRAPATAPQ